MYDYVKCEYPLPGNPPEWAKDAYFQTKDFDCLMDTYIITADGKLLKGDPATPEGEPVAHATRLGLTCTINFYTSNVVASGPGTYTSDGEDAHWLEYSAEFVKGELLEIQEIENRKEPAAKSKPFSWPKPTEEEKAERAHRMTEPMTGYTIFVQYGGSSPGYFAEVVFETERQLVLKNEHGNLELMYRSDRDCLYFDTQEESIAYTAQRKADWDAKTREYEEEIARKAAP